MYIALFGGREVCLVHPVGYSLPMMKDILLDALRIFRILIFF